MKDPNRAEPWFYLGQLYEVGYGNSDEDVHCRADAKAAFQYYKRAARLGHPRALVKAGDFLYSGKGTAYGKKDKNAAFNSYQQASEFGSTQALNNMALMLENGFEGM